VARRRRLERQTAALPLDSLAHRGKTHAGAIAAGREEGIEDPHPRARRDARARVGHADQQPPTRDHEREHQGPARLQHAQRVAGELPDRILEHVRIDAGPDRIGRELEGELDAPHPSGRRQPARERAQELDGVDFLERRLAAVPQVEQRAHAQVEPIDLRDHV
jgi:hypothetical protein